MRTEGRAVDSPVVLPTDLRLLFDYLLWDTSICLGPDGTYYLTGTNGEPEGLCVCPLGEDTPLTRHIDASLFEDDDGKVYFVCGNGKVALIKDDVSGLTEPFRTISPANARRLGNKVVLTDRVAGNIRVLGFPEKLVSRGWFGRVALRQRHRACWLPASSVTCTKQQKGRRS